MSMSDILAVIEKVLLVSPYYSERESGFSVALSVIALIVGGVIGKKADRLKKNPYWIAFLVVALGATFFWHWLYLYDAGGAFVLQLVCRAVFFLCLGALGFAFGKDEAEGAGGD